MMSFARLAAPLMTIGLIASAPAVAQTATAPASVVPVPTVAPVFPLSQIPGVIIQYYDVTGLTTKDIRASLEAQRPKDPVTGQAMPTSSKWGVGVDVKKATTDGKCRITGATPAFKAEVVMPRLVPAEDRPAPVLAEWQRYVTSLEAQLVASLRPISLRLPEVEKAVLASSCEGAGAAANKAIAEISKPPVVVPVPAVAPPPATPEPAPKPKRRSRST